MHETIHNSKITIIISFFIVIINLNSGCGDNAPIPKEQPVNFGIYLLEDKYLKRADIVGKDINELKLQSKPIISDKDIDFYDFSSHIIYLKTTKDVVFPEYKSIITNNEWWSKPFVVAGRGEKYFFGIFAGFENQNYSEPLVDGTMIRIYPKDIIPLCYNYNKYYFKKDIRNNEKFRENLKEVNKYGGGISIDLDSIKIFQSDISIIEFNIIIKNNDKDNLYIFDPDKMGIDAYHYYSHRIILMKKENNEKFFPINLGSSYVLDWFIKIKAGTMIRRKIISKYDSFIFFGNYYVQTQYDGPYTDMEKEKRTLNDGRIWLGPAMSNILDITFDKDNNCRINNKNVIFE